MLKELYWLTILNMTALLQESTKLIWLENAERHWKRRDEESCVAVCCFTRSTHLLTHHHKHGLPSEMPVSNCSITHRIHQTWPPVTSICFQNWRNSWKDGHSLPTRMLSTLQLSGWLEDQDQEFFYNEIQALEKRWTKCISVGGDYVEKGQNNMCIFRC